MLHTASLLPPPFNLRGGRGGCVGRGGGVSKSGAVSGDMTDPEGDASVSLGCCVGGRW